MLSFVVRNLLPPAIPKTIALVKARLAPVEKDDPDRLFDGDDALFKEVVATAGVYGEYGCGASTIWVAGHARCSILAVDSSRLWLDSVRKACGEPARIVLHHADMGPVGDWGRPVTYDGWQRFDDYTDWVWRQDAAPDVVLVDGRFRICCFLTSLLNARRGTRILFDDYMDRPAYHFIERFLAPARTCGRQALFIAPGADEADRPALRTAIAQFRFVMD